MVAQIARQFADTASETGEQALAPDVLEALDRAYDDAPLPIGSGQTISQPFIVAIMTQLARVEPTSRVLEVGTGCGYQAAVLAELTTRVHTIERVPELAGRAEATLQRLGYTDVEVRSGDGYLGWAERAPFDAILVTAGAQEIPPPLIEQLAANGRLIIPVASKRGFQNLLVVRKDECGDVSTRSLLSVAFVPLIHDAK
jgi:protein-L-isoaspartate(D-aspartate) O-methyltransferase